MYRKYKRTLRRIIPALLCLTGVILTTGCGEVKKEMKYLGILNYGAEETNIDNVDSFRYRFSADGKEKLLAIENGKDYPIQNTLKEGYDYVITTKDDTVTAAEEKAYEAPDFTPVVSGVPGEKTLTNLLKTALMPVGTTLYIFGGGWNWQDLGPGPQSRTIGVSPTWVKFFREQDENFTYKNKDDDDSKEDPANSYYPFGRFNEYYYAGLDCSAYLSWAVYNTFEKENGRELDIGSSTEMAKKLSEHGWGTWTQKVSIPDAKGTFKMLPGDIMSINGHVWMSLGTCSDGSIVILHSTPSKSYAGQPGGGVQISALGGDETCEAYLVAEQYMSLYYPEWSERYPAALKEPEVYFEFEGEKAGKFSWDVSGANGGLTDPDGLKDMEPAQVLELLFSGR